MFKKVVSFLKSLVVPAWVKQFIKSLRNIILSVLKDVSKDVIEKIKVKIADVAKDPALSGEDKMKAVLAYFKSLVPGLKDNAGRLLIEQLVAMLKAQGVIA